MAPANLSRELYRQIFVIAFLAATLITFLFVIKDLIITVILAATFSALIFTFEQKLEKRLKGRRALAAVLVLSLAFLAIGIPILGMLAVAAKEAIAFSESLKPWFQEQMNKPLDEWMQILKGVPYVEHLREYKPRMMEAMSQSFQVIGQHLTKFFSVATFGTVEFIFKLFIWIYASFLFLMHGDRMFKKALGILPLTDNEKKHMTEKGLLVMRSTMRSVVVIGLLQGFLTGLAFFVLGIQGAVFWGIIVAILSAIPGLGAPLVWIPAVIYLFFSDRIAAGVGLTLWGVLAVGLVDNFLRPIIISQEADVPELLIFLSILGGLAVWGLPGLVIGPVLVSVLKSATEIYSKVFTHVESR